MSPKHTSRLCRWIAFSLLAAACGMNAFAGNVSLDDSIRQVPAQQPAGLHAAHRPWISRAKLNANELADNMEFQVAMKMRNFFELQQRVVRHEVISHDEMAAKYYPLPADYATVEKWLTSQGFTITRRDNSRLAIFARSSVVGIQKSLHANFSRVTQDGKEYTSAISAPSIPAEIAPLIVGINGLQPHIQAHKHLMQKQAAPAKPNSLSDNNPPFIPGQIAQAYGANGLYSSGVTGAGQSIAIAIDTYPLATDLTTFWQNVFKNTGFSQTPNVQCFQVVSGSLPPPEGEETLDVEWSGGMAPGAQIRLYAALDLQTDHLDQVYQQIYDDATQHPELGLHQMSMSYGIGEQYTTPSQVGTDSQYFANLASAGVTIFASSGDGAATPGPGAAGDTSGPLQVENPASDPNVTGVGGTSITLDGTTGMATTETAWSLSTGGTSIYFFRPSWQTGAGMPAGPTKCVPDISAPADPATGAYVILNGAVVQYGGTSWSSPTWAGLCALINQARANVNLPAIGLLGPHIYPLLGGTNFRDITSGSNITTGTNGSHGYNAGPGYDLVTGIGVPIVQALTQTIVGLQTTPPSQTITPGQNAIFTVASTGTATTYQWQRMPIGSGTWSNLAASGTYAGPNTAALTINGVTTAMSGDQFQCIVTTGTSVVTSAPPSVLVVDQQLVVRTLAGQIMHTGTLNGSGTNAQFNYPSGVAVDSSGNVYVADFSSDTIRKVTSSGTVTTPYGRPGVAGSGGSFGNNTLFNNPNSVAIDSSNNIYVADSSSSTIRKITASGSVSLFAGRTGLTGNIDGSGTSALFNNPQGVAVDSAGNVYVADTGNETVRKITPAGAVSTIAGTPGVNGYLDATGTSAVFNGPISVAADSSGHVYVADLFNQVVRKISSTGAVTTPYGQPGVPGHMDGIGNGATFNGPIGLCFDATGNLYIVDSQLPPAITSTEAGNNTMRRASTAGVVSTIAGNPNLTGSSDGTGSSALFYCPQSVAIGSSGVVYIADTFNQTIRDAGYAPLITTVQGTQTIVIGQSGTFSVSAVGTGPFTYQWYYKGTPVSGATGSTYTVSNASTSNAGNYYVVVTDAFGGATSSTYTLVLSTGVPSMPQTMRVLLLAMLFILATYRLSTWRFHPAGNDKAKSLKP